MFILGFTLIMFLLILLLTFIPVIIIMGIGFFVGGMAGGDLLITVIIFVVMGAVMLIPMLMPAIGLFIGYFKIYKPLSNDEWEDRTRTFLIINIILCFLSFNWIAWIGAILYIIILSNWKEWSNPAPMAHAPPMGYYGAPQPVYYHQPTPKGK